MARLQPRDSQPVVDLEEHGLHIYKHTDEIEIIGGPPDVSHKRLT